MLVVIQRPDHDQDQDYPTYVKCHPYTLFLKLSTMFAASPPLTRRAITMMTPAIHSRLVGGTANITIPSTTSATRTPVRRVRLLADGGVAAKVGSDKGAYGGDDLVPGHLIPPVR